MQHYTKVAFLDPHIFTSQHLNYKIRKKGFNLQKWIDKKKHNIF